MRRGGFIIAVSKKPAAIRDDCARADIVILSRDLAMACSGPRLVVDRKASLRDGTIAVYFEAGGLRLDTVRQREGDRPWSRTANR